ncbi:MAG: hypothetical protein ISN28_10090, partial [Ectothiorhodospiraceae bacterium AqS1]|nr:hypothetical protein [Ectothiorhodospiraceae bacterium AqS1]
GMALALAALCAGAAAQQQPVWRDLAKSSDEPASPFTIGQVLGASAPLYTGINLHVGAAACSTVNVYLGRETGRYFELVKHRSVDDAVAAAQNKTDGLFMSVHMEANADDHYLRLFFKPGLTPLTTALFTGPTIYFEKSAGCSGPADPAGGHRSYPMTSLVADSSWTDQGLHTQNSRTYFPSSSIAETAFVFHKSTATCRKIDVALASGTPAYVSLQKRWLGSAGDRPNSWDPSDLANIHMERGHQDNQSARVLLGTDRPASGKVTVTVVGTPNSSCPATGRPEPLTVAFAFDIVPSSNRSSWTAQGRESATATRTFWPAEIADSATPLNTGIAFHQSSSACRYVDVELANGTPDYLELALHRGDNAVAGLPNNVYMERNQPLDTHARLMFKAGARVAEGGTVTVAIVASPGSSCRSAGVPGPLSLSRELTIGKSADWEEQGKDDAVANDPVSYFLLSRTDSSTDTGLAFHRSSTACRKIDVALADSAPNYVELVRYQGEDISSKTGLSNIHMEKNNDADEHVRLFLKARARVATGVTVDVVLVATPGSDCA